MPVKRSVTCASLVAVVALVLFLGWVSFLLWGEPTAPPVFLGAGRTPLDSEFAGWVHQQAGQFARPWLKSRYGDKPARGRVRLQLLLALPSNSATKL